MIHDISIIGSGRVARALGSELYRKGLNIVQVMSRNPETGRALAEDLTAGYSESVKNLNACDLIFIAVNDSSVNEIAESIPPDQSWAHTSGAVSLKDLKGNKKGVFYPLQTFSEGKLVNWKNVPICIESEDKELLIALHLLASTLSRKVQEINSNQRKALHLAAVFACNFSNRMYTESAQLLENVGLDFDLLHPLIAETSEKAQSMNPGDAQTGPAQRGDESTMNSHLELLADDEQLADIYRLISKRISK